MSGLVVRLDWMGGLRFMRFMGREGEGGRGKEKRAEKETERERKRKEKKRQERSKKGERGGAEAVRVCVRVYVNMCTACDRNTSSLCG